MVRYGLVVASFALLFAACSSTSVVRARRLEIVDSAGRVRGVFECDEERGQRPILTLCDENSQPLMALAVGKSGDDRQKPASLFPYFFIESADGENRVVLGANDREGAGLRIQSGDDRELAFEIRKDSTFVSATDSEKHAARAKLIVENGALRLEPVPADDKKAPGETLKPSEPKETSGTPAPASVARAGSTVPRS